MLEVTIKKNEGTFKMHFFGFLIKVDLIDFNLMVKGTNKKNCLLKRPKVLRTSSGHPKTSKRMRDLQGKLITKRQ